MKNIKGYIEDKYWFVESGDLHIIAIGKNMDEAIEYVDNYIKKHHPDSLGLLMNFKHIGHNKSYYYATEFLKSVEVVKNE